MSMLIFHIDKPLRYRVSLGNLFHSAIIFISAGRRRSMIQTTLRLPERMYKVLKVEAKKRGMTMNAFVISVLWKNVEVNFGREVIGNDEGI